MAHVVFTLNIVLVSSLCFIYTYTIENIPWASFTFNRATMRLPAIWCIAVALFSCAVFHHHCLVEFVRIKLPWLPGFAWIACRMVHAVFSSSWSGCKLSNFIPLVAQRASFILQAASYKILGMSIKKQNNHFFLPARDVLVIIATHLYRICGLFSLG